MSNPTTTVLTADDIKAIRGVANSKDSGFSSRSYLKAEVFPVFAPGTDQVRRNEGLVTFVHIKEGENGYVGEIRKEVEIFALARIESYGRRQANRYIATKDHYRSSNRSPLRDLANILRAGDELLVYFTLSNNTETLKKVGYDADSCDIQVIRKGKVFVTIHVDHNVFPAGSSVSFSDTSGFTRRRYDAPVETETV